MYLSYSVVMLYSLSLLTIAKSRIHKSSNGRAPAGRPSLFETWISHLYCCSLISKSTGLSVLNGSTWIKPKPEIGNVCRKLLYNLGKPRHFHPRIQIVAKVSNTYGLRPVPYSSLVLIGNRWSVQKYICICICHTMALCCMTDVYLYSLPPANYLPKAAFTNQVMAGHRPEAVARIQGAKRYNPF